MSASPQNDSRILQLPQKVRDAMISKCITQNGCLLYTGALTHGYAKVFAENVHFFLHRAVMIWVTGKVDGEMETLHKCPNKHCVNILRLSWGTSRENQADRHAADVTYGWAPRGELHPRARMSNDQVIKIWNMYWQQEIPTQTIAKLLSLPVSWVDQVRSGKCFSAITAPLPKGRGAQRGVRGRHIETDPLKRKYTGRGESHPQRKLSECEVLSIWRARYVNCESIPSIAKKHRMSKEAISAIVLRRAWTELTDLFKGGPEERRRNLKSAQIISPRHSVDGRCQLTDEKVRQIFLMYHEQKIIGRLIAKKYGVSVSTVYSICTQKTWKETTKFLQGKT